MKRDLFGLAERGENGVPDPDRVLIWGMEAEERAVMFWMEDDQNMTATSDGAEDAEKGIGRLSDLGLVHP